MLKKTLLAAAIVLGGAGAANAADVIDTVPVADWTGFYAGVHAGYGWGSFDYDARLAEIVEGDVVDTVGLGHDGDADGFFAGVQAGFNWQMDALVLGIEGDVSKSWIDSDDNGGFISGPNLTPGSVHTETDLDWFGTLRLRAGFLATDGMLIYATGGLAWGNVDSHVRVDLDDDGFTDVSGGDSDTRMGWTLGGGLEYKVSEAVSVKAEYLYVDLGDDNVWKADFDGGTVKADNDVSFHTIRAGLNFHF
jgi:outer membrane immunogenic protein